jgi:hypothetical protein
MKSHRRGGQCRLLIEYFATGPPLEVVACGVRARLGRDCLYSAVVEETVAAEAAASCAVAVAVVVTVVSAAAAAAAAIVGVDVAAAVVSAVSYAISNTQVSTSKKMATSNRRT